MTTDYSAAITYTNHIGYGTRVNTPVDSKDFTSLEAAQTWVAENKDNAYCHNPQRIVITRRTWKTETRCSVETVMEWKRNGVFGFGEWKRTK